MDGGTWRWRVAAEPMHFDDAERVVFTVGTERFEALGDIPVELMFDFVGVVEELDTAPLQEKRKVFEELFRMVLLEESADRFIARWRDRERPIGFTLMNQIVPKLLEAYGMRPTEPSPSSSGTPGSPDGGTSSTVGTSVAVLNSVPSD